MYIIRKTIDTVQVWIIKFNYFTNITSCFKNIIAHDRTCKTHPICTICQKNINDPALYDMLTMMRALLQIPNELPHAWYNTLWLQNKFRVLEMMRSAHVHAGNASLSTTTTLSTLIDTVQYADGNGRTVNDEIVAIGPRISRTRHVTVNEARLLPPTDDPTDEPTNDNPTDEPTDDDPTDECNINDVEF